MRVVVGGISHETNTFSVVPTRWEDFTVSLGDTIHQEFAGTHTPVGGFLDAARDKGWLAIPTVMASAVPGGTVTADAAERLLGTLLRGIIAAQPVDAVLLRLHGAMVSEGHPDGDGWILREVRRVVGADVPVMATLDLHANLSQDMVSAATMLVGYDTYPHIDGYERAKEAAEWVTRWARHRLVPALAKPRVLAALPTMFTGREPMTSIFRQVHALEEDTGGVITVAGGFPYADVVEAGFGVLAYGDSAEAAEGMANRIAHMIESRHREFSMQGMGVEEALARARTHRGSRPLVLADIADNPGAGTPCDGTVLLAGLIAQQIPSVVLTVCDPVAVSQAFEVGEGRRFRADLGGHVDDRHGSPLPIDVEVVQLTDGRYTHLGPMSTGATGLMGRTAVLRTGSVTVVTTEIRSQPLDLGMVHSVGIDPHAVNVFLLKSSVHFRGAFGPIADEILEVDTPGISNPDYRQFAFRHVRRPVYPLDSPAVPQAQGPSR